MSGFYVLDVPEFVSLVEIARRKPNCRVGKTIGHYIFVEFDGEIELDRDDTAMNEAVWFGCLSGGLDGKIEHFDSRQIRLVATNEPILIA